jgi:hypothetical protein
MIPLHCFALYWHGVKCCCFVEFWCELVKKTPKKWKFAKKISRKCEVFLSSGDFPSLMFIITMAPPTKTLAAPGKPSPPHQVGAVSPGSHPLFLLPNLPRKVHFRMHDWHGAFCWLCHFPLK